MLFLPAMRVWVLVQWVQACYVINLKKGALMIIQLQILRLINCQRCSISYHQKKLTDRAIKQTPNAIHISG